MRRRQPATPLAPPPLTLDLSRPEDNLTAWMKMRGSLEGQDVYFWFTGGLDVAIPGEPIRPFVTVETLILRRTQRIGAQTFHVTDWEASFYRHPETGEVVDELRNPVTGQAGAAAPLPGRPGDLRVHRRPPAPARGPGDALCRRRTSRSASPGAWPATPSG